MTQSEAQIGRNTVRGFIMGVSTAIVVLPFVIVGSIARMICV